MTPDGLEQLKSDEGCKLTAYPDPLSGGDPWTIGYGQTGPDICEGVIWTQATADAALMSAVDEIEDELAHDYAWWPAIKDTPRGDTCVGMRYNLGSAGFAGFKKFIGYMAAVDYESASLEMLDSQAARQLPQRYGRYSDVIADGVYP